ncbi:TIGR04282 family arsenosugar biosynthesis glycosyltransferase [Bermanella sp. R86510]|uniref:TIGR04282 family arsenosugar biosynthesis glycosyltransferase n=1 Tax=unclassified Bermanella TaxID=2627862 RepID=UPI0037CA9DCB
MNAPKPFDTLIIQFAKYPKLGQVKTRMQPVLSPEQSQKLHIKLLTHTYSELHRLTDDTTHYRLALDVLDSHLAIDEVVKTNEPQLGKIQQQGDSLGARMLNAMEQGLREYEKVIIVGSDCPVLSKEAVNQAILALEYAEHTFIPAEDGGYVLIGAKKIFPAIYDNMPWGTGDVLDTTKRRLELANEKAIFLDELWDVDRPEDYKRLISDKAHFEV